MNKNQIDRSKFIQAFSLGLTLVALHINLMNGGGVMGLHDFIEIMANFIALLHVLDVLS
ncbi:hypothetical protein IQ265_28135 [Nodosilinea sp. LEGE 06152]|uniref:hypothetical protein n=1 Tax=Nodosilinea sp. LEGE 06152 TaxID=2777966 RepID=UPI00187F00A0|nr:hypothetical protein [Nodosilinea sp. LEGE 06152]MBE9160662.1 hypothetical protein [Nodosilinea sp. LEGE 06152]